MNSDRLKNLTNSLTVGINFVSARTRAASRVRVRAVARRRPPSRSGPSPSDSLARASSPSVSATSPPIRSTDNKHQVRPLSLITAVLHASTDARWPTGRGRVSGPARFRRTGRHGRSAGSGLFVQNWAQRGVFGDGFGTLIFSPVFSSKGP